MDAYPITSPIDIEGDVSEFLATHKTEWILPPAQGQYPFPVSPAYRDPVNHMIYQAFAIKGYVCRHDMRWERASGYYFPGDCNTIPDMPPPGNYAEAVESAASGVGAFYYTGGQPTGVWPAEPIYSEANLIFESSLSTDHLPSAWQSAFDNLIIEQVDVWHTPQPFNNFSSDRIESNCYILLMQPGDFKNYFGYSPPWGLAQYVAYKVFTFSAIVETDWIARRWVSIPEIHRVSPSIIPCLIPFLLLLGLASSPSTGRRRFKRTESEDNI